MPSRFSPPLFLGLLLLVAVSVAGWVYGWHWKQVASGGKPTQEEALIIDLQDQLDLMRTENERLAGLLKEGAEPIELGSGESDAEIPPAGNTRVPDEEDEVELPRR